MIDRVVIVGAGGVGGAIAGLLAAINVPVQLVARGTHLKVLQSTGLTLETPDETRVWKLPATESPDWQSGDLAILAVKSQDTANALSLIPAHIPVVCAQNGVENELLVSAIHPTIGMMAWIMAAHMTPGIVSIYSDGCPGILDLGAIAGDPGIATEATALLCQAGFDSKEHADIMHWKRTKLVSNLPGILQIATETYSEELCDALVAEGVAVLTKANLPQINLKTFMARVKGAHAHYSSINGQERPGGSLLQSKDRGSSSEVEYLNGYISRLGAQLGVPTPWNDRLLVQTREHTTQA